MHFYCNICDKEVKTNPQHHRICGKVVQTHTKNNPEISDVDRIFYDHVINHNQNFE